MKIAYYDTAVKILSFCSEGIEDDPDLLLGKFQGSNAEKQAKKEEERNRKTIGLLRFEQHMRLVMGKSSSTKVILDP